MATIVFPLAGFGSRFQSAGYTQTKPLIHAGHKTIIEWSLETIKCNPADIVFVIRKDQSIINGLGPFLRKICPEARIVELDSPTNGSLETVLRGLAQIDIELDQPLYIHTSDLVIPQPVTLNDGFIDGSEAITFTFKANNPSYSYCENSLSDSSRVTKVIEKQVVSQIANVGIYGFRSASRFLHYAQRVISGKEISEGEFYVSSVFAKYIHDDFVVTHLPVDEVHVVGTPRELEFFTQYVIPTMNPRSIGFVSDHSGFQLKEELLELFKSNDFTCVDYGCFSKRDCDYSDYVPTACRSLAVNEVDLVIGLCASGQGVNITANHHEKVISVVPPDIESLIISRRHNSPNFISVASSRWTARGFYEGFREAYYDSHFEGGRHSLRLQKVFLG